MKGDDSEEYKSKKGSNILTHNLSPENLYRLWEIERHGSQEAAEKATTVQQSAFSRAIKELNEQLTKATGRKVEIYKTQKGRNVLTTDGEIVYSYAQKMMRTLQEIPQTLGSEKLTIDITAAFPRYLTYFLLRELLSIDNPVKFRLVSVETGKWADELLNGTYDLVLADGPIPQYAYSPTTGAIFAHKEGHTYPIIVADEQLINARSSSSLRTSKPYAAICD